MSSRTERAERFPRCCRIIKGQRGCTVVGDDVRQRRQIALQISTEKDGVENHDSDARQQQRRRSGDHNGNHQLLLNRDVAKGAHLTLFFYSYRHV